MKVSAMKTYKDFIIYKGQDKEVQIPFAVSGFTDFTASFYTDKEYEILKTAEDFDFDGEWASIFFDNTDLDLLNDGVLRYTFNYKIDGVDVVKSTNSAYTLKTPENYSAHTADEIYQEGVDDQKAKLSSITIVENGTYQAEDGYSAVTVNVSGGSGVNIISTAKTVTQDVETIESEAGTAWSAVTVNAINYGNQRYESGYSRGASDGYQDGYSSGYTDGMVSGTSVGYDEGVAEQKAKLTGVTITENGQYNRPDGYSAVTVNVSGGTQEPFFGKVADMTGVGFALNPFNVNDMIELEFICPNLSAYTGQTLSVLSWDENDCNVSCNFSEYWTSLNFNNHNTGDEFAINSIENKPILLQFYRNSQEMIINAKMSGGLVNYSGDSPTDSYVYVFAMDFWGIHPGETPRYLKSFKKYHFENGLFILQENVRPRSDGKMWDLVTNQEAIIDWVKYDGTHPKTFNTLYEWEIV